MQCDHTCKEPFCVGRRDGAAAERARIVAILRERAEAASRHRHAPYGDGCEECGKERALEDAIDAIEHEEKAND